MSRPILGVSTHVFGSIQPCIQFPLLAARGLTLIELALNYFPLLADPDCFSELRALLQANGICVSSCHLPYGGTVPALGNMDLSHPDQDIRRNTVEAGCLLLDRLCQIGGRYLVVHPGNGNVSPAERSERHCHCIDSLRLLTAKRGASPVCIAVENMPPGNIGGDSRELCAMLDRLDRRGVGVCLDVNHSNLGENPVEALRRYGARILTTHISDNDGVQERHWMPGRGVIAWKEWGEAMLAQGYAGPIIYETSQEHGETDSITIARICETARKYFGL